MFKSFAKLNRAALLEMGLSEAEADAMLAKPGGSDWTTLKIPSELRDRLATLARKEGLSMGAFVAKLVEEARREKEGDQT